MRAPLAQCLAAMVAAFAALATGNAAADLVETIARVKPSIVAVGLYRQTDNPQFSLRGTGFAVGDGSLIATNAHVIADQGNPANPSGAPTFLIAKASSGDFGRGTRRAPIVTAWPSAVNIASMMTSAPKANIASVLGSDVKSAKPKSASTNPAVVRSIPLRGHGQAE